jgi:hypothetical protein
MAAAISAYPRNKVNAACGSFVSFAVTGAFVEALRARRPETTRAVM